MKKFLLTTPLIALCFSANMAHAMNVEEDLFGQPLTKKEEEFLEGQYVQMGKKVIEIPTGRGSATVCRVEVMGVNYEEMSRKTMQMGPDGNLEIKPNAYDLYKFASIFPVRHLPECAKDIFIPWSDAELHEHTNIRWKFFDEPNGLSQIGDNVMWNYANHLNNEYYWLNLHLNLNLEHTHPEIVSRARNLRNCILCQESKPKIGQNLYRTALHSGFEIGVMAQKQTFRLKSFISTSMDENTPLFDPARHNTIFAITLKDNRETAYFQSHQTPFPEEKEVVIATGAAYDFKGISERADGVTIVHLDLINSEEYEQKLALRDEQNKTVKLEDWKYSYNFDHKCYNYGVLLSFAHSSSNGGLGLCYSPERKHLKGFTTNFHLSEDNPGNFTIFPDSDLYNKIKVACETKNPSLITDEDKRDILVILAEKSVIPSTPNQLFRQIFDRWTSSKVRTKHLSKLPHNQVARSNSLFRNASDICNSLKRNFHDYGFNISPLPNEYFFDPSVIYWKGDGDADFELQ